MKEGSEIGAAFGLGLFSVVFKGDSVFGLQVVEMGWEYELC